MHQFYCSCAGSSSYNCMHVSICGVCVYVCVCIHVHGMSHLRVTNSDSFALHVK
jgi:hypothetical protein